MKKLLIVTAATSLALAFAADAMAAPRRPLAPRAPTIRLAPVAKLPPASRLAPQPYRPGIVPNFGRLIGQDGGSLIGNNGNTFRRR